jgi:hypothetical protein
MCMPPSAMNTPPVEKLLPRSEARNTTMRAISSGLGVATAAG